MSLTDVFTHIFEDNAWKSEQSRSGQGSTLEATAAIRRALPAVIEAYGITSVLDIPCGDFSWWPFVKLPGRVGYIGADIVPAIIQENRIKFPHADFRVLNLVRDELPQADLIFCRDCLGHLSNRNVWLALENIRSSGAKYLMATTYYDSHWSIEADVPNGGWRPINMLKQFDMGNPVLMINEDFTKNMEYHDKSLGLWRL